MRILSPAIGFNPYSFLLICLLAELAPSCYIILLRSSIRTKNGAEGVRCARGINSHRSINASVKCRTISAECIPFPESIHPFTKL
jgi:hypothetical protein